MHVAVNMVGARHRYSVVLMLGPRVIGGIGLASLPSRHEALSQCCFIAGPPSKTMGQHQNNSGTTPRVCWVTFIPRDDRLLYPAAFSRSITFQIYELSLSDLYHYFQC